MIPGLASEIGETYTHKAEESWFIGDIAHAEKEGMPITDVPGSEYSDNNWRDIVGLLTGDIAQDRDIEIAGPYGFTEGSGRGR